VNFTVIEAEQRTPEWYAARAGRLTGSRACDMLAKIKTGEAAARRDYRVQLSIERLTGTTLDEGGFISKEMQHGIDTEPQALAAYEADTGLLVRKTGFLAHNEFMAGCSLDGDIQNFTGILELKCPKPATHVGYLKSRVIPTDYLAQITHNLWVSGAQWADYVSFDPRLPEGLQYLRIRVTRESVDIPAYEAAALKFLAEVTADVEALNQLRAA
jgi:predicted phage-related endonuclease